jgi:hypothetical protein
MGDVAPFGASLPVEGWRWRDRNGVMHLPSGMLTRHLFHTLRMLWNNSVPAHMRVGSVRLYRFDPHLYPRYYLREAVVHIGRELLSRKDLVRSERDQVNEMASWFAYADFDVVSEGQIAAPKQRLSDLRE